MCFIRELRVLLHETMIRSELRHSTRHLSSATPEEEKFSLMSFKMNPNRSFHLLVMLNFCYLCVLPEPVLGKKSQYNFDIYLPNNLILGAGTSAFQVEGAWNSSGKSESYIEWMMHNFFKNVSADVSSDSYHKYKEDVKILNDIGLNMYRFSISWPRLLPTGGIDNVNKEAVAYYHALLDELEKNYVEPIVTLHHYDHPVLLEQSGGWLNETNIQLYVDYARFVFQEFGNRMKHFITFNEVNMFCHFLYSSEWEHSSKNESVMATNAYTCAQNILKAHAEVYHMYHKDFDPQKNGKISIGILCENYEAKRESDYLLANMAFEFGCGWIAHPIYSKIGDYPILMKLKVRANSKFGQSKLPTFTPKWVKRIRGTADFFALSHYSSHLVEPASKNSSEKMYLPRNSGISLSNDPRWVQTSNGFSVFPYGLRNVLRQIKKRYNNPPVYIIENGYANDGQLDDDDRINFLHSQLRETIAAIKYDKCDVRAYFYRSLVDSFEFKDGFTTRFGLAHVDFEDPCRPRILRKSATWLREVIKTRKLT